MGNAPSQSQAFFKSSPSRRISEVTMSVDLQPGESRDYWKQQDPDLWFKPTYHEVTPEIQRPSKISEY
ncbi:LOW QUALITY PROTEIN: hypothetical protein PHMEG_00023703 [Phytophthora megakarya]|uniref:Uncharacterized protein n=1 Tax=Phytophthora megakarya TaxID=4795 RepID=A0A225VHF4_9STRA|nr:LOW QUALITY PROTEIN: hypothetical protein PHMEG_00023703 [Phytophthora megakarya]